MNTWYSQLNRPPLTPPSWVFGPVWTALYIMIALAICIYVYKTLSDRPYIAYATITIHLTLNFIWTPIFFKLQSPGWALIDIMLLVGTLVILLLIFWKASKLASVLLFPYFAWVLFATYLNAGFYILN